MDFIPVNNDLPDLLLGVDRMSRCPVWELLMFDIDIRRLHTYLNDQTGAGESVGVEEIYPDRRIRVAVGG